LLAPVQSRTVHGDILALANAGSPGKWPLKWRVEDENHNYIGWLLRDQLTRTTIYDAVEGDDDDHTLLLTATNYDMIYHSVAR